MPGTDRILDTNAFIRLAASDPDEALPFLQRGGIVLCAPVLGELLYGAQNSKRPEENLAAIERIRLACRFQPIDQGVCEEYGRVRARLRAAGRPIPENDVWIAATAISLGLPLVTDDRHFRYVPGLTASSFDQARLEDEPHG